MAKTVSAYRPSMSDDAVKAKTGKTWAQWFAALDKAGAKKLPHLQIASLLYDRLGVPGWWSQMVTVEYERARGLRAVNQQADGFTLNTTKTFPVNLKTLYRALADAKTRARWFPKGKLDVTSTTDLKYFRAKWDGGTTRLEINVYSKGDAKSQIAVQHSKFSEAKSMAAMRAEWKSALERLGSILA
jgi:hypothetical protein